MESFAAGSKLPEYVKPGQEVEILQKQLIELVGRLHVSAPVGAQNWDLPSRYLALTGQFCSYHY